MSARKRGLSLSIGKHNPENHYYKVNIINESIGRHHSLSTNNRSYLDNTGVLRLQVNCSNINQVIQDECLIAKKNRIALLERELKIINNSLNQTLKHQTRQLQHPPYFHIIHESKKESNKFVEPMKAQNPEEKHILQKKNKENYRETKTMKPELKAQDKQDKQGTKEQQKAQLAIYAPKKKQLRMNRLVDIENKLDELLRKVQY